MPIPFSSFFGVLREEWVCPPRCRICWFFSSYVLEWGRKQICSGSSWSFLFLEDLGWANAGLFRYTYFIFYFVVKWDMFLSIFMGLCHGWQHSSWICINAIQNRILFLIFITQIDGHHKLFLFFSSTSSSKSKGHHGPRSKAKRSILLGGTFKPIFLVFNMDW